MFYQILVFVFAMIPVNKNFENTEGGIEVIIGTNGVHTDITMPAKNNIFNWYEIIPLSHFQNVDTTYNYISMGWGDKGFYINTPTWDDLTIPTAFKALFLASDAAMHVTYYSNAPPDNEYNVRVFLNSYQYKELINLILPYFQWNESSNVILIPEANYSDNDNFYEAHDKYYLFNTSNNWTNKILKKAGIRTVLWSPLDAPIIYQLKKIE